MGREADVDLVVSLPPEACAERIRDLDCKDLEDWFVVQARVKGARFSVYIGHPTRRNPGRPFLYGVLEPWAQGTRLAGRFRLNTLLRYMLVYWMIFSGLMLAQPFVARIFQPAPVESGDFLGVFLVLLLGLALPGMVFLGWRAARGQKARIARVLSETFQDVLVSSAPGESLNEEESS